MKYNFIGINKIKTLHFCFKIYKNEGFLDVMLINYIFNSKIKKSTVRLPPTCLRLLLLP